MAKHPLDYLFVPRRVFDKYTDRMAVTIARVKEDYRADIKALLQRLRNLEKLQAQLTAQQSHGCSDPRCKYCDADMVYDPHSTGEP